MANLANQNTNCKGVHRVIFQAGFTLVELLIVIALISILALGAAAMFEDDGHWSRDELTRERWNTIRKAIIGEPNIALNGSPYVAGYVNDMGRLPFTIAELVSQDPQFDADNDGENETPCSFNSTAIRQPDYGDIAIQNYAAAEGFTNTVSGGWRGPYIHTAGSKFYGDGWFGFLDANETYNPKDTQDGCDFKWLVTPTPASPSSLAEITDLEIQSLGNNRVQGGSASAQDYPSSGLKIVNLNEWTLASPVTFNIQFNRAVQSTDIPTEIASVPHELQLVIYRYVDNGDGSATFDDIVDTLANTSFPLTSGMTMAPAQTVSLSGLPIGRYSAVVWCTFNTPSDTSDDEVYDGDCDGGDIEHSPVYFTLTQSSSQVSIVWNLP